MPAKPIATLSAPEVGGGAVHHHRPDFHGEVIAAWDVVADIPNDSAAAPPLNA
jgi:hypothetical protein